ncbi:MAG: hypothetical protein GX770_08315 [Firmicutes bacterium]|nr:hypothetical protein [Bacillota bacterium]
MRLIGSYCAAILLTLGLLFCHAQPGSSATPAKVTILLVDRISLHELAAEAGPFLRAKISESACALITTNTAGTRSAGNTHAPLGAGAPARSDHQGGLALNYDEIWMGIEAGLLYQQLTGDPSFPTGQVILPRLPEAFRLNFSPVRTVVPCLLGQVLHENRLRTAVFGNADPAPPTEENSYYTHNRFGPWLAANNRGLVDYGDVGNNTLQPGAGLLPWETDYRYLVAKYKEFRAKTDLLVLELGDFARLEALSSYLFDRQITAEKKRLYRRLEHFTQTIWPLFDLEHDTVILLTPTPSLNNLKQGAYLTPCLVWGKNFPAGFLSSPTTRHPGLVANVDLVPTVLQLFNLNTPVHASGRSMTAGHKGGVSALIQMEKKINAISLFRRKVLPVFLNGVALCLPLTFLAITLLKLLPLHVAGPVRTYLWLFIIFVSALPTALHLASQLALATIPWFVGATLAIALSLTFLSVIMNRLGRGRARYAQLPAVISAGSLLPLWLLAILIPVGSIGHPALLSTSVLGHDPMLGARFYGIGNELSGLFLGCLLGVYLWQNGQNHPRPRQWTLALFLAAVLILSLPHLGANFGAGLTAMAITMALALYHRQTKAFPLQQILTYLFILFLFALVLLAFDYLFAQPEQHSHFGLLLTSFKRRGFSALNEIVRRKIQVNLRLLGSRWMFLFLSAVLTFAGSYLEVQNSFTTLFVLALLGGGVGLLVNDSGLVFAALFFYPLATTGLLLFLAKGMTVGKN